LDLSFDVFSLWFLYDAGVTEDRVRQPRYEARNFLVRQDGPSVRAVY
jgi:hypothetical protein